MFANIDSFGGLAEPPSLFRSLSDVTRLVTVPGLLKYPLYDIC